MHISIILMLVSCASVTNKPETTSKDSTLIPLCVINGTNLQAKIVIPLLGDSFMKAADFDEALQLKVEYLNFDDDKEKEILLKFQENDDHYKYYLLDRNKDSLFMAGYVFYCCEGLVDNNPPIVDLKNKTIWSKGRQWGTCREGEYLEGYQLHQNKLRLVIEIPTEFSMSFSCDISEPNYWASIKRTKTEFSGNRISIDVLFEYYVQHGYGPSKLLHKETYPFTMRFDKTKLYYMCMETCKDTRLPPLSSWDMENYVEAKYGLRFREK